MSVALPATDARGGKAGGDAARRGSDFRDLVAGIATQDPDATPHRDASQGTAKPSRAAGQSLAIVDVDSMLASGLPAAAGAGTAEAPAIDQATNAAVAGAAGPAVAAEIAVPAPVARAAVQAPKDIATATGAVLLTGGSVAPAGPAVASDPAAPPPARRDAASKPAVSTQDPSRAAAMASFTARDPGRWPAMSPPPASQTAPAVAGADIPAAPEAAPADAVAGGSAAAADLAALLTTKGTGRGPGAVTSTPVTLAPAAEPTSSPSPSEPVQIVDQSTSFHLKAAVATAPKMPMSDRPAGGSDATQPATTTFSVPGDAPPRSAPAPLDTRSAAEAPARSVASLDVSPALPDPLAAAQLMAILSTPVAADASPKTVAASALGIKAPLSFASAAATSGAARATTDAGRPMTTFVTKSASDGPMSASAVGMPLAGSLTSGSYDTPAAVTLTIGDASVETHLAPSLRGGAAAAPVVVPQAEEPSRTSVSLPVAPAIAGIAQPSWASASGRGTATTGSTEPTAAMVSGGVRDDTPPAAVTSAPIAGAAPIVSPRPARPNAGGAATASPAALATAAGSPASPLQTGHDSDRPTSEPVAFVHPSNTDVTAVADTSTGATAAAAAPAMSAATDTPLSAAGAAALAAQSIARSDRSAPTGGVAGSDPAAPVHRSDPAVAATFPTDVPAAATAASAPRPVPAATAIASVAQAISRPDRSAPAAGSAADPAAPVHRSDPAVAAAPATDTPAAATVATAPPAIPAIVQRLADAVIAATAPATAASPVALPSQAAPAAARTMTLELGADGLGTVTVRMHVTGRTLDLRITTTDAATLGVLERGHDALKGALGTQDYQLHSLVIQGSDAGATAPGGNNASHHKQSGDAASDTRRDGGSGSQSRSSGEGRPGGQARQAPIPARPRRADPSLFV